jgi:signal transduction histidine kinase
MKLSFIVFIVNLLAITVHAQFRQTQLDNLQHTLHQTKNDTIRMDVCFKLGVFYDDINLDSSVFYSEKGSVIANRLQLKLNEAEMLMDMSFVLSKMGNYPQSLNVLMRALTIAQDPSSEKNTWRLQKGETPKAYRLRVLSYTHSGFGWLYFSTGNNQKRIAAYFEAIDIAESIRDTVLLANVYVDMGDAYFSLNKLDSAIYFGQKSLQFFNALPFSDRKFEGDVHTSIGSCHQQMGKFELAKKSFEKAIRVSEMQNNASQAGNAYVHLADLYRITGKADSSIWYYKNAVEAYKSVGNEKYNISSYRKIADYYLSKKMNDSSFAYLRLAAALNDSLGASESKKLREYQLMVFNEQLRLQQLEKEKIETKSKIRTFALLAGIVVVMIIASLLYRNNRNRQKANVLLEKQKEELQTALATLKLTQAQLIQSEKMASLGELTAGIAHEIQNPLNFVNNFSEVSKELMSELNEEMDKGDIKEAKTIAGDVTDNLDKIHHHGKRAATIIKGMLQHSHSSSGTKEPIDINALAGEYLHLAWQAVKRRDDTIQVELKTDFDPAIEHIGIISQDIGRVLLNIYNNAFYAVMEKKKTFPDFNPTITVSTRRKDHRIEITVRDNGNGIPEKTINKIFQPFFTTKPTGEGTGLGLSLSYDIIKAHGGEIKVESKNGIGTEFLISLPSDT